MLYNWLKFLHVLSALGLLGTHGVSMVVLYRIRAERDRAKIQELITLSGATILPMYISIGLIVVFGVWGGFVGQRFDEWWIWAAIGLLIVTIAMMTAVAKPYFRRVKDACQVRPSGVPRVSDEELGEILGGASAHVITAIGSIGLIAIVYLMVFKPGIG